MSNIKKEPLEQIIIAKNKKAYFDYEILEEFEAGIMLAGSEVKSLRVNGCTIVDSHADLRSGAGTEELFLTNLQIPEYKGAKNFTHKPRRERKLLLHKREIRKLIGKIKLKGLTIIPLLIYFNHKGLVKITLGLGRGKNKADKREVIKEREWKRDKAREMKK
ncbi:MAG TPA: SsrA-binding protein [Alphaproteobacteria bacterium]|nr:SsrA-binding protein [Alphaproteobacteria bacterium]